MGKTGTFGEPPGPQRQPCLDEAPNFDLRRDRPVADPSATDPSDAEQSSALLEPLLVNALDTAALPVASALIETFGSLAAVLSAGRWRLAQVPGMTEAAAHLLEAAHAAVRWAAQEQIRERDLFDEPAAVESYVRATLRCRPTEEAHGLFLDAHNRLIRDVLLSRGIVNHTPLYPREVVRHALVLDASAMILVHNHPSGDPTPSALDIDSSHQVARALAAVNVALHDHLIVGDNRVASLRALGMFR